MFDGKTFFAPVENPQRIVDFGTGTGIWALDVGDQYPGAHGRVRNQSLRKLADIRNHSGRN